ncbi:hypothetical protein LguiB_006098 [Lonicera macranthoides]
MMNGKPRGNFKASRGLRQGDPLSPFIFVIVSDVLNILVERAKVRGLIEGFSIGMDNVSLSHLQFADDTIFFLSKNEEKIGNLMGILDIFGYASGLKINRSKTKIVGINVEEEDMRVLAGRIGCSMGCWPMSYLGLPLGDNPMKASFWNTVVENIGKRLKGWYKGCILRGGKLTLIHSVLNSIPIYFLSIFKIPATVAKNIEKLMRNFLWESMDKGKGEHLVAWKIVSKSKEMGGLGIGNLVKRNEALLGKWLWRFSLETESLWHKIIKSKYGLSDNSWDSTKIRRGTYRNPWKAIVQGFENFRKNIRYKVGNGSKVSFWSDLWLGNETMQARFPALFRVTRDSKAKVADYTNWVSDSSFSWDIVLRRNVREEEEGEYMALMGVIHNLDISRHGENSRVWVGEKLGVFTAKSFFKSLTNPNVGSEFTPFKMVWKSGIPTKVKVLSWLASLRRVNTADLLQIKRPYLMISPACCILCKRDYESIDHLVIHCSFASSVWGNISKEFGVQAAFPRSWCELLSIKWTFRGNKERSFTLWRCYCKALLWCIWKERNSRIFENKVEDIDKIWDRIKALASLWAYSSNRFGFTSISEIQRDWTAAMI